MAIIPKKSSKRLLHRVAAHAFPGAGTPFGASTASSAVPRYRSIWQSPVLVLLVIALTLAGAGLATYFEAKRAVTLTASDNLAAIATLKTNQIEHWLESRRSDAKIVSTAPAFVADLQQWLNDGQREGPSRERLHNYLRVLADTARYRDVSIRSAADGAQLLTSGGDRQDTPSVRAQAKESARQAQPLLEDMHFNHPGSSDVDLGFFEPVFPARQAPPIAVLHVTVDPLLQFFPMLQRWPGSSPSAETLLLRFDDHQAVFLNRVRHRDDSAFNLRQPLTTPRQLAAQVAAGSRGALEGIDYREVPSLGYAMPVPGTPWFLIAKIDAAEVYAHLDRMAFHYGLIFALLALAGAWWVAEGHRHELAHYRQRMQRDLLSRRIDFLTRHANDSIILCDTEERIIEVNDRAMTTYGYARGEMIGMRLAELRAAAAPAGSLDRLALEQGLIFETEHRCKDGGSIPVEVSVRLIDIDGERYIKEIVRDISGRKKAAARIERLSRLYAAISRTNQAIIHGTSLSEVFGAVCEACVDVGRFKLAWIGIADTERQRILPVAASGDATGYLDGIVVSTRPDLPGGRGPTASAYREQRVCRCADYRTDPAVAPWQDRAAEHGLAASIALPLRRHGKPHGALTVYGGEKDFLDEDGLALLGEMANNISFFIDHLDREAQRAEAETALRRSEARLQQAQQIGKIGDWRFDLDSEALTLSPEMFRLFQRAPSAAPPTLDEILACYLPPVARQKEYLRQVAVDGVRAAIELRATLPDGQTAYHAVVVMPDVDAAGRVIALYGTTQDITERKLAEKRLAASAREIEDLYQNAPCGYHSIDADGIIVRINDTELRWLGYAREEVVNRLCISDLMSEASRAALRDSIPKLIARGGATDLEMDLIRKDGSVLHTILSATVVTDKDGKFKHSRSTLYDITERKRLESERAANAERVEQLSRRLVAVQEEERRRLVDELHDHTSPNLAAIRIILATLQKTLPPAVLATAAAGLEDAQALLADTTVNMRELCADLRPSLLDYTGLVPALEGYAHQFGRRAGVAVRVDSPATFPRLAADIESALFRIAQEAFTNSIKHGHARNIALTLVRRGERIVMTLTDDGIGFDPGGLGHAGNVPGLGLITMRERAEFGGGTFDISSQPGQGTTITVGLRDPAGDDATYAVGMRGALPPTPQRSPAPP